MSHVDNVILAFSILEDSRAGGPGKPDEWPIMDQVNAWLNEHASRQRFGNELSFFESAYGGGKFLEAPMFVAAFNYLPEQAFLEFLRTLPWKYPREVQVIIRRQHDDLFEIVPLVSTCASEV